MRLSAECYGQFDDLLTRDRHKVVDLRERTWAFGELARTDSRDRRNRLPVSGMLPSDRAGLSQTDSPGTSPEPTRLMSMRWAEQIGLAPRPLVEVEVWCGHLALIHRFATVSPSSVGRAAAR